MPTHMNHPESGVFCFCTFTCNNWLPLFEKTDLYDKIYREDVLWEAWRQVKVNKGAPGVDGLSIDEIIEQRKEEEIINKLQKQLKAKRYKDS